MSVLFLIFHLCSLIFIFCILIACKLLCLQYFYALIHAYYYFMYCIFIMCKLYLWFFCSFIHADCNFNFYSIRM